MAPLQQQQCTGTVLPTNPPSGEHYQPLLHAEFLLHWTLCRNEQQSNPTAAAPLSDVTQ
jgi:hypothetical protein